VKTGTRKKRALITGVTGQDGSYLTEFLLGKGYEVFGLIRRTSLDPLARIDSLSISRKIRPIYGNMRDSGSLERVLKESNPHEIYNLAAQSDVGISFKVPEETLEVNYFGLGRLVNEAFKLNPEVRIYQASTSEMFGNSPAPQSEVTPFNPQSPYAASKAMAHTDFIVHKRESMGLLPQCVSGYRLLIHVLKPSQHKNNIHKSDHGGRTCNTPGPR